MTASTEAAITTAAANALGALGVAASAVGLKARLELSKAKHGSLGGQARVARFVASLVPFYQYDEAQFFKTDAAPDVVVAQRRADFARLADLYRRRYAGTLLLTAKATNLISDLQFTEAYRVPFQFSRTVRRHLPVGAFLSSSSGITTTSSTEIRSTILPALMASICSATISTRSASIAASGACVRSARYWAPIIRCSPTMRRASCGGALKKRDSQISPEEVVASR